METKLLTNQSSNLQINDSEGIALMFEVIIAVCYLTIGTVELLHFFGLM